MRKQIVPIVNEKDRIICYKERYDRKPEEIIRVSALWVENSKGQILMVQRSFKKRDSPGLWGPSVAGTVEKGETYRSNIIKEAEEEIGLKDFKLKKGEKQRLSVGHEYYVQYYIAVVDRDIKDFKIDKREVERLEWFDRERLRREVKKNPERFTPSTIVLIKNEERI